MTARRRTSTIPALDLGFHQLEYCDDQLRQALRDPNARTEAALAWLYLELQDNRKALEAIRRVAEVVDDAICRPQKISPKAARVAAAAQYTRTYLAGVSRRAKAQ